MRHRAGGGKMLAMRIVPGCSAPLVLCLTACGGFFDAVSGESKTVAQGVTGSAPDAAPGFPGGYRRWPARDLVLDEGTSTFWRSYRGPGARPDPRGRLPIGAVLVKEHLVPGEDEIVTRVDVRRRTADGPYGGWVYESYDPATRQPIEADTEACDLCHQAAPLDGTYFEFPRR